jgi:hypothetical protein
MSDTDWVIVPDCPRAMVSVPEVAVSGVLGDIWALKAEKPGNIPRLPATSPRTPTAPIAATGIGQCLFNSFIVSNLLGSIV